MKKGCLLKKKKDKKGAQIEVSLFFFGLRSLYTLHKFLCALLQALLVQLLLPSKKNSSEKIEEPVHLGGVLKDLWGIERSNSCEEMIKPAYPTVNLMPDPLYTM